MNQEEGRKHLNKLKEMMHCDELGFTDIRQFCVIGYKMNANPLPIFRKYVDLCGGNIPVHYKESESSLSYAEAELLLKTKADPLLILNAIKREGMVRAVHVIQKIGTEFTRL